MVVPFKNEPGIDFSVQTNVERFNEELRKVKSATRTRYTTCD